MNGAHSFVYFLGMNPHSKSSYQWQSKNKDGSADDLRSSEGVESSSSNTLPSESNSISSESEHSQASGLPTHSENLPKPFPPITQHDSKIADPIPTEENEDLTARAPNVADMEKPENKNGASEAQLPAALEVPNRAIDSFETRSPALEVQNQALDSSKARSPALEVQNGAVDAPKTTKTKLAGSLITSSQLKGELEQALSTHSPSTSFSKNGGPPRDITTLGKPGDLKEIARGDQVPTEEKSTPDLKSEDQKLSYHKLPEDKCRDIKPLVATNTGRKLNSDGRIRVYIGCSHPRQTRFWPTEVIPLPI
jgi:hypothetical protein